MKLFVDASALVAVLGREPERVDFVERIDQAEAIYSAVALWETTSALCRLRGVDVEDARRAVLALAETYAIITVPIGVEEARLAVEAFARYGKGRHPAQLNMGDCFAYACAKANGARLLYKGRDFARTDLA